LVVEDSSTDNTVEVVKALGTKIVSLPTNLGYGGALRVGFDYAVAQGYEYVITMDADGQHDPLDIPEILNGLLCCGKDLVIGSRFLGQATYRIPRARRLGMFLFSIITSAAVGAKITDTTCGFMGVGPRALRLVADNCATDFPNAELICIVSKNRLNIGEVPVRVHGRNDGQSMFTLGMAVYYPFKLSIAIAMAILRQRRTSL
jgi:glycosyltransferase involved in cell wall biosynthesis